MGRAHLRTSLYLLLVMPVLGSCFAWFGLVAVAQVAASRVEDPRGSVIPVCVWARNSRVGLWWNSSVTPARAFANSRRYNAVCLAVPWSDWLPANGRPAVGVP
jgi:hypothetical protein